MAHKMLECYDFYNELLICSARADQIALLADDIISIEKNQIASMQECQYDAQWHLSDITNDDNGNYPYDKTPQGDNTVYILDTWVDVDHYEFEGRASNGKQFAQGRNSHGTHVAGLVASRSFGVNKNAKIVSVQVLNQDGNGPWSQIIAALSWVAARDVRPSIINMSIGGPKSQALEKAIHMMYVRGWNIVVAAGNWGVDACNTSPAGASAAVTVGAHDNQRQWAKFSNHGKCVDVSAPGVDVLSLYPDNKAAYSSGTSMAAPIVAEFDALNADHIWNKCTHIVYDALTFDPNDSGKIIVGDQRYQVDGSGAGVLIHPKSYVPWLRQLLKCYPHLKLYWSLPPAIAQEINVSVLARQHGWQLYFDQCAKMALELPFDGLEINLSMCSSIGYELIYAIEQFPYPVQVVLPTYQSALIENVNISELIELYQLCDSLVVNTFGYMKFCMNRSGSRRMLTAECECSMSDFEPTVMYIQSKLPLCKVQLGMDTMGVEFERNLDDPYLVNRFRMLSMNVIENIIRNECGVEMKLDSVAGSSLLDTMTSVISYDCIQIRMDKLNFAKTNNMQGVCIGDLKNDINHRSPTCLLSLTHSQLIEVTDDEENFLPQTAATPQDPATTAATIPDSQVCTPLLMFGEPDGILPARKPGPE